MSRQTFYMHFDSLQELEMIKVNRTIGKAKLYKIDSENKMVKMITKWKMSIQIAKEETKLKRLFLQDNIFVKHLVG